MFDSIGLGLALNILFWLVVVAIVCVLVFFVLREFSPGSDARKPKHARVRRSRQPRISSGH